jgi:hypothetical protein
MQQYCKKVLPTEQEIVGAPLPATGLIASHPLSLTPNCGGRFKAGESCPAPETNQPLSTSPSLRSLLSFPPHARFIAWPCPPVSPLHRSNFLLVVIISRGLLPFPSAQRLPTLIRCASRPLVVGSGPRATRLEVLALKLPSRSIASPNTSLASTDCISPASRATLPPLPLCQLSTPYYVSSPDVVPSMIQPSRHVRRHRQWIGRPRSQIRSAVFRLG